MTDEALIETLLKLSEDDKLTDDEADAVEVAALIIQRKSRIKNEVKEELKEAMTSLVNMVSKL